MAVTSCPVCVTPSATTPLSAHMMTSPFFSSVYSADLLIPAILITASSSFPRLNNGFATIFHRCLAASLLFSSAGQIFSICSFNFSSLLFALLFSIVLHSLLYICSSSVRVSMRILIITVHSHVNRSADWHGGCKYCPECISSISKGDSK